MNTKKLMENSDSVITFLKFLKILGVLAVLGNIGYIIKGDGFLILNLLNVVVTVYGTILAHTLEKLMDSVLGKIGGMMV